MIELHLIGYTSDLRYLVLDLDPDGERGRYRLVVDGDLLLTLDELRDLRAHAGMDVGVPYERLEERFGLPIARAGTEPAEDEQEAPAGEPRSYETPLGPPDDRVRPDRSMTTRPPTSQPPPLPPTEDGPPPTFRLIEAPEEPPPEAPRLEEPPPEEPSLEGPRLEEPSLEEPRLEEPPGGTPEAASDERRERDEVDEDVTEERAPDEGSTAVEGPEDLSASEEREVAERDEAPEVRETTEQPAEAAQETGSPPRDDRSSLGRDSELSPAQIQARLRAGRRPESVAEEAGTDVAWVERWLPPILTERAQVLQEAQALHLERPRKGPSRAPLGEAVAANLRRRHLDPDEDAEWSVKRRASGRWSINVRYRYRNKTRSATWALDREEGELTASSRAARELGWTDER